MASINFLGSTKLKGTDCHGPSGFHPIDRRIAPFIPTCEHVWSTSGSRPGRRRGM